MKKINQKPILKRIPIIESNRLILKPLGKEFLSYDYVNWLNDKDVTEFMSNTGIDYEDLKIYLEKLEKSPKYFWAIIRKNDSQHIGNLKIDPVNVKKKIGEYGIMIGDKSSWGKGYGSEASIMVLNYCFNELGIEKVFLGVINNNINAIEMYKKIGFKKLYTKKNHFFLRNEKFDFTRMFTTEDLIKNNNYEFRS